MIKTHTKVYSTVKRDVRVSSSSVSNCYPIVTTRGSNRSLRSTYLVRRPDSTGRVIYVSLFTNVVTHLDSMYIYNLTL